LLSILPMLQVVTVQHLLLVLLVLRLLVLLLVLMRLMLLLLLLQKIPAHWDRIWRNVACRSLPGSRNRWWRHGGNMTNQILGSCLECASDTDSW